MPGNDVFGGNLLQFGQIAEKAADAAVDNRQVLDKQEIAGEESGTCVIENGQIVVGVAGRPSLERQQAVAEVKLHLSVNEQRRRNDAYFIHQRVAKDGTE